MWGEDWGVMIWGGGGSAAAVQIPFGPWMLLLLGFILGVCAVYANRSRMARLVPFVMVFLVPVVAVIAANLPHVFIDRTVADADQVNENFNYLEQKVSSLQIDYGACSWLSCRDAPEIMTCPIGEVQIGIDLPEFGGDETGCSSGAGGTDDFRIRCCKLNVSAP